MLAPELLSPQTELVDCLLEQTKNMEENLMAISKSDFRFALHRMEVCIAAASNNTFFTNSLSFFKFQVERIRYVVTSYLRIRLEKIEKFLGYLLNNENKRQRNEPSLLTEDELKFAQEYSICQHFH